MKSGGQWARHFGAGLMATTAFAAVATALPAGAQTPPAAARPAERDFNIPPQRLTSALALFGRQSGVRTVADNRITQGLSAPGVRGRMAPADALKRLLAGTGLDYALTDAGDFTLRKTVVALVDDAATIQLPPVSVEAQNARGGDPYADPQAPYKADRLSSSKYTEPLINIPRSTTVITKEAIADKNATTIREIARSTAGVTLGSGEGGFAFGDRFFIRGFDARGDVFVDGVRDPAVSIRETFNIEQVEILRGPGSSYAGRGTTGGALNIVTKQAESYDFYKVEGTGGFLDATKRGTFDVNKSINDKLDIRINGMAQGAGVAGRDYTTDNRWGIAAALTYRPMDEITVKAGYSHTRLWGLPDFGVPYNQVAGRPVTDGDVPRSTYYGIINRDYTNATQDIGTLNAEWRLNDWVTLENKIRASNSVLNYIGTIPENPSAAAAATAPFSSTPTFFSGYVQLNAQSRYQSADVLVDQPQATFKFDTGPIRHTAILGAEFSHERIGIDSYAGLTSELTTGPVAFASSGAPIVSVFNPIHEIFTASTPALTGNPLKYNVTTNAVYLMDTMNYKDFILFNAGVRYDGYNITSANKTSSRSGDWGIPSYNVGLVVKPMPSGSVYVAYATSSDPVGNQLDATTSQYGGFAPTQTVTQIFAPHESSSVEVGTKWEIFQQHMLVTAALFQTTVTNARETAPAGLPGYVTGQIVAGASYRVQGIDIEWAGRVTDRWSLMGGLVLMDPKVTKSIVPTNVGLQLANIAPQSFNMLTKYRLTDWLELGGQLVYTSEIKGGSLLAANGGVAYPNKPNPTVLPAHWRVDLFGEARVNEHVTMKLFAQNLLNNTYYDSLYQSAQPFIAVAPGRNVYLVASVKF